MSSAAQIIKLCQKDLLIEFRRGELSVLSLLCIIGLGFILAYGVALTGLSESERVALSPVLSIALLFISALSFGGKFAEYDREEGALQGLVYAGIPSDALYLSRCLSLTVLCVASGIIAFLTTPALLSLPASLYLPLAGSVGALFGAVLGMSIGLAALIALVAPMALRARAGAAFILSLTLPLALPLFFAGCEILSGAQESRPFWWSVVIGLNLMYLSGGVWLHSFLLKQS